MMEGPCADSEEKREPAGDIDTVVVDGLKVLDPKRPIREADMAILLGPQLAIRWFPLEPCCHKRRSVEPPSDAPCCVN
jgi:hypothetical protein